jgi:hypothetical protein
MRYYKTPHFVIFTRFAALFNWRTMLRPKSEEPREHVEGKGATY